MENTWQSTIRLSDSWKAALGPEFSNPSMQTLKAFLMAEKDSGKAVFPQPRDYFRALDLTPLEEVRVVILGQDPYHGDGQANGLAFSVGAFSVGEKVKIPPSLANIYKELKADLGILPCHHGSLEHWAKHGVLLLNAVLSVERAKPASHQGKGWERFTDCIIRKVSDKSEPVVFLLWGNNAQKKAALIDQTRHLVLSAAHPSPLSAHNGFFGCRHFSKANEFLQTNGRGAIDWQLPQTPDQAD